MSTHGYLMYTVNNEHSRIYNVQLIMSTRGYLMCNVNNVYSRISNVHC